MIRRLLVRITVGVSLTTAAIEPLVAQTKSSITIAGGPAAPVGNLGDAADIGYHFAAGLNFGGTLVPIGLRFEGAYTGFQLKNSGGDDRIINGTANIVFNLSRLPDSPYIIGGLGYYHEQFGNGSGSFRFEGSRNAAGVNAGGGLRFPLSGLNTFVEARYHLIFSSTDGGSTTQFIPITFGLSF